MRWEGRQGEPFISQNRGVNPTTEAGFMNKFYWNTAMTTCLYVVYGCFCAQCNMQSQLRVARAKNIYIQTFKDMFADLCQRRWRNVEFETAG